MALAARVDDVIEHLRWRQLDAWRAGLQGLCYWTLRREGRSAASATAALGPHPHAGVDPRTGTRVETTRRRLRLIEDLPRGEAYTAHLRGALDAAR